MIDKNPWIGISIVGYTLLDYTGLSTKYSPVKKGVPGGWLSFCHPVGLNLRSSRHILSMTILLRPVVSFSNKPGTTLTNHEVSHAWEVGKHGIYLNLCP